MAKTSYMDNESILELIACPKVIRSKPRDPVAVNRNYSQRFFVYGQDDDTEFTVFISSSQTMPMDFSIGLMMGDYLLYRVNGFHGTTRKGFFQAAHHAVPHTHTLTARDINSGRKSYPSSITETSGEYIDLQTACLFFFRRCGIIGFEKYFTNFKQLSMFDQ